MLVNCQSPKSFTRRYEADWIGKFTAPCTVNLRRHFRTCGLNVTLFVTLVLLAGPAAAGDVSVAKPALVYGGAAVADLGSTEYFLTRGGHEQNPLMRGRGGRVVLKLAIAGGLTWLDVEFQKKARKDRAWRKAYIAQRVVTIAAAAYLLQHNIRYGNGLAR